jgi:hypothetical protein
MTFHANDPASDVLSRWQSVTPSGNNLAQRIPAEDRADLEFLH